MLQVIAATNRVDILDPALLRSGRLDRKIEFPMPNEEARARIMQIHSRKMNVRYVLHLWLINSALGVLIIFIIMIDFCLSYSVVFLNAHLKCFHKGAI